MAADALATETGSIEFGILGPLEVSRAGRSVTLGGPRQRAVLALLLLEANRVVSMDRLAEEVWAGHPPDGWTTTLQTYVFHLRRALEPDRPRGAAAAVIVTRDRGYLLEVDRAHLDSAVFEDGFTAGRAALNAGDHPEAAQTLRRVLGLWRGPVLANLADYAFTRPEAARLHELRLAALEARIDADLALGRHDALTAELDGLVREHPLRERLHGQLMVALYRSGRQADALSVYRRARDLLAGELGIDPGASLERLHAAVLGHDPGLDCTGTAAPAGGELDADAGAASPAARPGSPGRTAAGGGVPAWPRRGRRLLVVGSALALVAAVCILAVTRPWMAEPIGLPANSVGVIDESGRQVGPPIMVGSPAGLAYGAGSVWAVNSAERTVSRINPATRAVIQTIPVGPQPTALTVTATDVWVTNSGDASVSRINTAANAVVATVRVGNVPVAIASGPSGVWVANQGDDTVDRIDPTTGNVTVPSIEVGGLPTGIAVGEHAVWVANSQDGTVSRIDPVSGDVGGPVSVGAGPAGIAVTPAAVWVANSLGLTVSRLDPATDRVTATIGVGDGPSAITVAGDGVWVGDQFDATLHRIDPRTDRVDRVVSLGSSPQGIVVAPSGMWVAARPFGAAGHRGGTLIEVTSSLPLLDPVHDITDVTALAGVYDGLLGFRKAGGATGGTLVPDLAVAVPRPTDGGTTYTFTLRRDIRYSNGGVVQASDFRRGIQREVSFGDDPDYYESIIGARACHQKPIRCDLTAGIVVDDATGTVTFHLDRADPDLPYKLAMPWAAPAPLGAAGHPMDSAPFLPGTGPYMISRSQPNSSVTLVRNPHFRQWSYAAQPAGYPDVIRFDQVADPGAQQSAVVAGRADLVYVTGERYDQLALQYPTRVHSDLKWGTLHLFLNTRQPPFDNLKARRALNYAIDRGRLIRLMHLSSPAQATPTCQILPAGFPSHRPYCPYTTDAGDGAWHGPDLVTAARLAHESGTTHVPVTLWTPGDGLLANDEVNAYLVGLLRKLGYRVALRHIPDERFFATAGDPARKFQIGLAGWAADIPTASDFFLPTLSCSSFDRHPTGTANLAEFCDHQVDELSGNALAAQQTDPAAARKLWGQVDRLVTDRAPWVPILNVGESVFVSARVGNYQEFPYFGGPRLDQMWVR